MAKWHGVIGFGTTEEVSPGVNKPKIYEKEASGDVIRNTRQYSTGNNLAGEITMSNQLSVLAKPYIIENLQYIKYANWMGVNWRVTSVDVQYPRLILSLGGVYNAEPT